MFDLDNIDAVETPENDLEEVVMGLIINSGQARSLAYGKMKVSLVLVHAQDHLMTSMLARELVAELIELHEKVQ